MFLFRHSLPILAVEYIVERGLLLYQSTFVSGEQIKELNRPLSAKPLAFHLQDFANA